MSGPISADVRRRRGERRQIRAAVIALVALAALILIAYGKSVPQPGKYLVRAQFSTAGELHTGSDVRIAGVKVGRVRKIARGPHDTSMVTMEVDDTGRPIFSDARLSIAARLVLEGNDYVKLDPGTDSAPKLKSGGTIPERQTSVPVQLDQALDTFDLAGRNDLHGTIGNLAKGLGTAGAPATAPTGAGGLKDAARELDGALASVRQVAHASRGTQRHDLPRAVRSTGEFTSQLSHDPTALAQIVSNYDTVAGALAVSDRQLAQTLTGLDDVTKVAPPTLHALDVALPRLTSFSTRLQPTLRTAPSTFAKTDRLLDQVSGLSRPGELPAALTKLKPVTATLPSLLHRAGELFPQLTAVSQCISRTIVPTLDMKIQDGSNTTGDPVWLDAMHMATTLSGGSPNFDGNGTTIRLGFTAGEALASTIVPGVGKVVMGGPDVQGVRPTWLGLGVNPPSRPDATCADQTTPDLSKRSGAAPTWATSATPLKLLGSTP